MCVDGDCEENAECKKGKCECKKSWEGDKCDKKKVHVDVELVVKLHSDKEASDRCSTFIPELAADIEALEEDAATSFTTTVTGNSGGSGPSKSSYDIDVTVDVDLGDCRMDRTIALENIVAAIEDVDVSKLSWLSHSRD